MKTWTMLAAALALVLCVSAAQAAAKPKMVSGEITKIEDANITVQPMGKTDAGEAKPAVVVATTDATVVTIKGDKTKKVSDLKVTDKVAVTLDAEGTKATAITVPTMKGHGEGH